MKKSTRIRPAVESLESMLLLSAATVDLQPHAHALAPAEISAEATTVVKLKGTLKGTGKINLASESATASGSGNLGKVGTASFKVSGTADNLPTTVTLVTKKGNITIATASPIVGTGANASTTYIIVGGTKSYANVTGSGTILGTYSKLTPAGKFNLTVKFS